MAFLKYHVDNAPTWISLVVMTNIKRENENEDDSNAKKTRVVGNISYVYANGRIANDSLAKSHPPTHKTNADDGVNAAPDGIRELAIASGVPGNGNCSTCLDFAIRRNRAHLVRIQDEAGQLAAGKGALIYIRRNIRWY